MSKLRKINDLAFALTHEYMEPGKQFFYGKQIYDLSDEPELSENQQTVLDCLKKHFYKEDDNYPLVSVCRFVEEDTGDEFSGVGLAYGYLTMKQEAQVLLAFANWTMEQEEE
ncbi:hypothetical protein [Enterococcus faecalis]